MLRQIKLLAIASSIGMLVLLLGGALVTKTESGDGCGSSWPLCHGKIFPDKLSMELLIELSHRLVTGIVSIMVIILVVLCWKHLKEIPERKLLSALAIAFILIQSIIGAITVLIGQSEFFLALHFGISLISFSGILLLTLLILEVDKRFPLQTLYIDRQMKRHIIGVTIYCLVVIYTGALVRHMNASLICPSWPLCNNSFIGLPKNIYEWTQMGHRFAAGILLLWIIYIMILSIKYYRNYPIFYYGWIFAACLVSLQAATGALSIYTHLNLFISLLHAFFISCLFGLLSYMIFLVYRTWHLSESPSSNFPNINIPTVEK